jgi:hypothetical protein
MQEDHDDDPLIGPTRGDALCPLRSNARDFPQPMWHRFDNIEHLVPEGPNQFGLEVGEVMRKVSGAEALIAAALRSSGSLTRSNCSSSVWIKCEP